MIINSVTPATGGSSSANTCTMTIDADGVTCSDFSDHTPTGDYAVAVAIYWTFPIFLFYANAGSGEAETLAIADTSNPGWGGYLIGPDNSAILAGGEVFDTGGEMFSDYEGTYTGVVIEP